MGLQLNTAVSLQKYLVLLNGQLNGTLTGHGQIFETLKYSIITRKVLGLGAKASL